jgi:hypothetical protein
MTASTPTPRRAASARNRLDRQQRRGSTGRQPLLDHLRHRGVARVLRSVLDLGDELVQQAVSSALRLRRSGQHRGLSRAGVATRLHLADVAPRAVAVLTDADGALHPTRPSSEAA